MRQITSETIAANDQLQLGLGQGSVALLKDVDGYFALGRSARALSDATGVEGAWVDTDAGGVLLVEFADDPRVFAAPIHVVIREI